MNRGGQRMALGTCVSHGLKRRAAATWPCVARAYASGHLCLPSPPALSTCSSETETTWPFLNPGPLPSEEALLGRKRENWVTGIRTSFLGLMKHVILCNEQCGRGYLKASVWGIPKRLLSGCPNGAVLERFSFPWASQSCTEKRWVRRATAPMSRE